MFKYTHDFPFLENNAVCHVDKSQNSWHRIILMSTCMERNFKLRTFMINLFQHLDTLVILQNEYANSLKISTMYFAIWCMHKIRDYTFLGKGESVIIITSNYATTFFRNVHHIYRKNTMQTTWKIVNSANIT